MTASDFDRYSAALANKITSISVTYEHDRMGRFFRIQRHEEAVRQLSTALAEDKAGNAKEAWPSLVRAAEAVGYLCGFDDASKQNTPEQGIKKLLRRNAGKGGKTKGRNTEQKRGEVIKALIAAAPGGKWPSKAAFELKYHGIVEQVQGFKDTEHQRRKIMSHPDMQAVLPPAEKRRRW
jgi:hypothetical protein